MPKKDVLYKPKLTIRKREFDIDRAKVALEICEWQSKSEEYRHDWMKSYEEELKNLYNDKDDSDENFSIPLSLYHADKKHSSIYNVIFGMNKMIVAKPTSSEDVEPARKKEQWMNWELKTHMNQVDPELGISNQGDKFVHGVTAFGEAIGMVTWEVDRKFGKEYRIFKLPKFAPEEIEQPIIEGRAGGGDIIGGQPYLVGEQGPEVIVPQESGTVIPNPELEEGYIYGYKLRTPYKSEQNFFKNNPSVSGMATEDNRIILNPYSGLTKDQYLAVAKLEAARLYMKENNINYDFKITPEQRKIFHGDDYKNSPYSKDDSLLRQTIISRHIVGDPSAGTPTEEQKQIANELLRKLKNHLRGNK